MCIIETCNNANLFSIKKYQNNVITIFDFKVCPPMDPANPLLCILMWSIYTLYASGKLCPGGGTHFKIENGDDPIFSIFDRK